MFARVKLTGTMHAHCLQQRKPSIPLTRETDIPGEKVFLKTLSDFAKAQDTLILFCVLISTQHSVLLIKEENCRYLNKRGTQHTLPCLFEPILGYGE